MKSLLERKDRRVFPKIFRLLIFLGLSFSLYLFWRSEPLLAKNIVVTTDYDINANPELMKILENSRGQNILQLDSKILAEKIKNTDLKIKEVSVQKKIPGQLAISIKSRQALAAISLPDKFLLVDEKGFIFAEKKDLIDLPLLNLGLQNVSLGSRIDNEQEIILLILFSLKDKEKVATISQDEEAIKIFLRSGTTILFPKEGERQTTLNALQVILDRFKIESKIPVKIDLRFEKPVITF